MTVAATAWAFTTPVPVGPLERLLLILMADDTDAFGVVTTDIGELARVAVVPRDDVEFVLDMMARRGVLSDISGGADLDPDLRRFSFFLLTAWREREALPAGGHPELGRIDCP